MRKRRDRKTAILWICGLLSLSWIDGFDDAFTGLAKVLIGGVFLDRYVYREAPGGVWASRCA